MRRLYAFLPVCIALTGLPAGGCTRETPLGASLSTPGVPFASRCGAPYSLLTQSRT